MMSFFIKPLLPLTVKSETGTKTVMALIDTGASSSHICAELASELNLRPSRVEIHPNNEKYEWVKIEVGKPNGDQFTQVEIDMISIEFEFEKTHHHMRPSQLKQIAELLNIPLFDSTDFTEGLLIGTDLIPSLLLPSPSLPTRHFAISSNLNVVETHLGYYIQGAQKTSIGQIYYNWSHPAVTFEHEFWSFSVLTSLLLLVYWGMGLFFVFK